ncbi:PqqD family protein [Aestuariivirga sp.]|uniref:PqqD family protein n=1 Tax=Aestuariivirga sp. TaxID=2650926 RepID=UPI003919AFC7
MTIGETDIFQKTDGMSCTDIPDGLAVTGADGKEVHFLNPVAGAVYLLCDGAHDARGVATILREEYALEDAPVGDVIGCLRELAASGLIRKI